MSERNVLGTVYAGDTVRVKKILHKSALQGISIASIKVSILDEDSNELARVNGAKVDIEYLSSGANPKLSVSYDVTIPDNLPATVAGKLYTALTTVMVSNRQKVEQFEIQDDFEVISDTEEVVGAMSAVATVPKSPAVQYISSTDLTGVAIDVRLYADNIQLHEYAPARVTVDGRKATVQMQLTDSAYFQPSLLPYTMLWTVGDKQEVAPIFLFNPSLLLAARELHDFVNKNCTEWDIKETTFTLEQLAYALFRGACEFNGVSPPTNFSMRNAKNAIRHFWLQYSAYFLLLGETLNGIETDFSYTNQSVNVDVDRASKFQSFADSILGALNEKVPQFKTVLAKRGNTDGDGSVDPTSVAAGAIAVISIALSPVSNAGRRFNPYSWRTAMFTPHSITTM